MNLCKTCDHGDGMHSGYLGACVRFEIGIFERGARCECNKFVAKEPLIHNIADLKKQVKILQAALEDIVIYGGRFSLNPAGRMHIKCGHFEPGPDGGTWQDYLERINNGMRWNPDMALQKAAELEPKNV